MASTCRSLPTKLATLRQPGAGGSYSSWVALASSSWPRALAPATRGVVTASRNENRTVEKKNMRLESPTAPSCSVPSLPTMAAAHANLQSFHFFEYCGPETEGPLSGMRSHEFAAGPPAAARKPEAGTHEMKVP